MAQAVARGDACFVSQVLDCGAQVDSCGVTRCSSQVLDRYAQAIARGAATLPK
jgi:hypothetical protein